MFRIVLALFLGAAGHAAEPLYELTGKVTPEAQVSVSLFRVASPFTTSTLSDDNGRFNFKKLQPGAYTIAVFDPAKGEARRTIEVGPASADSRQRVWLDLKLNEADFVFAGVARRHAISKTQLAVSEKATHEYEEAQKELAKHDVESAEKHLVRAVEIAPRFSAAWNNLGTIAYQTRRYERAEECFRTALEADPQSFEPLVNLGGVLVNLHKLDEAWEYNLHAVLTRPNDALANSQMGMTYFELGKPDLAEKYFVEAVRIDPAHFSHPQLFLAEIHLRRGDRLATATDLESFLQHHPDWPQAAKMRATIEEFRK
jgi:Tfp pilus assembly protein PilF